MKGFIALLLTLAVLVCLVPAPWAQTAPPTAPLLSMQRLLFTAGVDYAFYATRDQAVLLLDPLREIQVNLNGAYNLGKYSSVIAAVSYGFDSKLIESRLGVRVRLYKGGAP